MSELPAGFWLAPDAPEQFAQQFDATEDRVITIDRLNQVALESYITGQRPPGKHVSIRRFVRALDHLLTGHVLAYEKVKQTRPDAAVAMRNVCKPIYEIDRLLIDVLLARRHGVARHDLGPWLTGRRAMYHASVRPPSAAERFLRRRARSALPLHKALPRAVAAVFDSPYECTLDAIAVETDNPRYLRLNTEPGLPLWS